MNPVTRRLLDRIDEPDLAELALAWDAYEEQIVSIYRAGACSKEAETLFEQRRRRAAAGLSIWSDALAPHWRATTIDGRPVTEDPFAGAVSATAAGVIGDRGLLRTLPAAREALNALLLERAVPPGDV